MKKAITLFCLMLFFVFAYGDPIDETTANDVGQTFLTKRTNSKALKSTTNLQLIYKANLKSSNPSLSIQSKNLFYVFNASSSGFVIVSGDDNVTPILGYSDSGTFDPNNIPPNVAKWLEGYKTEIRYVIEQNIQADNEIIQSWQDLKNGVSVKSAKTTTAVNPLVQTKWDQSPYYNFLCPSSSVTGCVATAMAQIMKYWNYPATGSGFHSYNHKTYGTLSANFGGTTYQWSSMPNIVNSSNDAVATLMYQVGVSVDMDYSPESSSAFVISSKSPVTNCAEYALKTYFGYKSTLHGVERINYTQVQWINLLKTEFDANRPVLYAGFGSGGGHCFVADGYDNNDYIHFNWGWGGRYDGYFQINALNPTGTGIGGGSGSYNAGQQAVIGIEPPAANQTYNMALYNNVTPSATTIGYGQSFTITTNIVNNGSNTFNGDYTAAIFDNSYNFVDYIQTFSGYTLQGGYAYTNSLVFSTTGLFGMLPGKYYVGIFYRPTGANWFQVGNNGSYTNLIQMTVVNSNSIELNSAMTVSPGTTLTHGQAASVNLNIINKGTSSFIGKYGLGLYNLDGSLAQTIGIINENNGLSSGYTYQSPYLTFSASSITVNPGTYLLAIEHNPNNLGWQLTGSTNYLNPIKITVVAANLQADIYEPNNSANRSYSLPISFTADSAKVNTNGSNCHIVSDNDFYKVILPSGYNYNITARLHDSQNSANGNVYNLDGLFSYSTDTVTWSDAYDYIMPGSISLKNGGTVYFHVAPYFAGQTGTYLLDITIKRTSNVGIKEMKNEDFIKVYPNPAKDFVNIDFNETKENIKHINLIDVNGQKVFSLEIKNNLKFFNLPLTNIPDGVYFLQIQTESKILSKQIIVTK